MYRITSKSFRTLSLGLVSAALFCAQHAANAQSASFNVTQATIVPGTTLQPGSYNIRVVDHLSDRLLLHIESAQAGSPITFIAVPSTTIPGPAGAVTWHAHADSQPALRGFIFRQGVHAEFIYPKDQAITLAKANGHDVLAIDPASENKPAELASLKKEDMEAVTLWALTPTKVAGSEPTISAAKYQAPAGNVQVAKVEAPATPIKRLPHTASLLPLALLVGLISFAAASLLFLRRTSINQA